MAGNLGIAINQIREDLDSIVRFFKRIWFARRSLSPKAQSFYTATLFAMPLISFYLLPWYVALPITICILITLDGIGVMKADGKGDVLDATFKKV